MIYLDPSDCVLLVLPFNGSRGEQHRKGALVRGDAERHHLVEDALGARHPGHPGLRDPNKGQRGSKTQGLPLQTRTRYATALRIIHAQWRSEININITNTDDLD